MNQKQVIIYIIESPHPEDFFDARQESLMLQQAFKLAALKTHSITVVNLEMFKRAITTIEKLCAKKQHYPVVHFSGHGNADGISLTDGTSVDWSTLRGLLEHLAATLKGKLTLSFSACEGWNGVKMGLSSKEAVFQDIVGPKIKVGWADSCLAFACFYNLYLNKALPAKEAVRRMNAAIGYDKNVFFTVTGDMARKAFVNRVGQH
jgi:hypothetical protein